VCLPEAAGYKTLIDFARERREKTRKFDWFFRIFRAFRGHIFLNSANPQLRLNRMIRWFKVRSVYCFAALFRLLNKRVYA
jgi:hypothetical protein